MPDVRVRGARLHCDRSGTGEPLLWITGFTISAAVFDPVLPLYEPHVDCIRYDNRGSGRSSAPLRPTTTAELAADAVGLLDALGVPSAHVYGISMGGLVAQELAVRFPHRVRGLILGGTGAGGPRMVLPGPRDYAAFGREPLGAGARARWLGGAVMSAKFRREQPERARELLRALGQHRARPQGMAAHWWATATHDTASRLTQVQAPTLVLHGEHDALVPVANARHLAARIPDAELAVLPGAGHAYLWEQPERAAELLTDWLLRRGPVAAGEPLSAVGAAAEAVTRALAVPLGGLRAPRTAAAVLARQLRRKAQPPS